MAISDSIKEETTVSTTATAATTLSLVPLAPAYFGVRSSAMAFQVFRADQHPFEVSTLTVDQIHCFKGNEVAACLGYARPRKAVEDHVEEEDKKTYEALVEGRPEIGRLQISSLTRSTSTSRASTASC